MNILIVEDEKLAVRKLTKLLEETAPEFESWQKEQSPVREKGFAAEAEMGCLPSTRNSLTREKSL